MAALVLFLLRVLSAETIPLSATGSTLVEAMVLYVQAAAMRRLPLKLPQSVLEV